MKFRVIGTLRRIYGIIFILNKTVNFEVLYKAAVTILIEINFERKKNDIFRISLHMQSRIKEMLYSVK